MLVSNLNIFQEILKVEWDLLLTDGCNDFVRKNCNKGSASFILGLLVLFTSCGDFPTTSAEDSEDSETEKQVDPN